MALPGQTDFYRQMKRHWYEIWYKLPYSHAKLHFFSAVCFYFVTAQRYIALPAPKSTIK